MKKRLLPLLWVAALGGIIALTAEIHGESTKFYGIADDQEQTIRFDTPVEITELHYIDGQQVSPGDLILEVRRPELYSERAIVEDKINEITSRDREETGLLQARLASLKEELQAKLADLDARISSLRSQHELNLKILKQLSEGNPQAVNAGTSPLLAEMKSLKKQRKHIKKAIQTEIESLTVKLNANERPVDSQISSLNERKTELVRQQTNLNVTANISGRIGSNYYKPGDVVPPYQPVLTVYPNSPSFVRGYIHENVINSVELGQEVWITTATNVSELSSITGEIESLGSRIVEYPERLKRTPIVSAWGREVIIRISGDHPLLLGEKVEIAMQKPRSVNDQVLEINEKIGSSWRYLSGLVDGVENSMASESIPTDTDNKHVTSASAPHLGRKKFLPST